MYDASQFGKASLITGTHDAIYGVPVYVTSQVPTTELAEIAPTTTGVGHRCLLVHKRCAGYAIGNLPMTGNAYAMPSGVRLQEKDAEALRSTVIADIMYGVKKIGNSYRGVRIISKVGN